MFNVSSAKEQWKAEGRSSLFPAFLLPASCSKKSAFNSKYVLSILYTGEKKREERIGGSHSRAIQTMQTPNALA